MKRLLSFALSLMAAASLCFASAQGSELSVLWWGSASRAAVMEAAIGDFQGRNQDLQVSGRSSEWTSYWPKLATRAAGASMPDVLLMDHYYIRDYAVSGLLHQLDGYVESGILPPLGGPLADASAISGQLYGYPMGVTVPVMFYDKRVTDAAGVEIPERMTFSEFMGIANTVYQRVGVPALCDGGLNMLVFYARALGIDPFMSIIEGDDRAVRMMFRDIEEFSSKDYSVSIESLSGKDLTVPDQMPMTDLTSWNAYGFMNQIDIFASFAGTDEIGYAVPPVPDDAVADPMYAKPCVYLSVSSSCDIPAAAAAFIAEVARESAAGLLDGEMGLPADSVAFSEAVAGMPGYLQDAYSAMYSGYPMPEPFLQGAGNIEETLVGFTDMIRTGELSGDEAVDLFMDEAKGILRP